MKEHIPSLASLEVGINFSKAENAFDLVQISRFETEMLTQLKATVPSVLESIREEKVLTPETEDDLRYFLDDFIKKFS